LVEQVGEVVAAAFVGGGGGVAGDGGAARECFQASGVAAAADFGGVVGYGDVPHVAGATLAAAVEPAAGDELSKHPDLAGIWGVWDVPAEGIMAGARASARTDLKIATQDLGKNVAIAPAENQLVVGLGAQRPFDQGVAEAKLAGGTLLGKAYPPYFALSALPVDHANVLDAWRQVYRTDAPADLRNSYQK